MLLDLSYTSFLSSEEHLHQILYFFQIIFFLVIVLGVFCITVSSCSRLIQLPMPLPPCFNSFNAVADECHIWASSIVLQ
uniref:Uncharacterized protein n=1 Tax=Ixodes scapularis TaxID=6945 RepID=A0A4D5S1F7_IXOSC